MEKHDPRDDEISMAEISWDIRREGRAWSFEEWMARRELTPRKFEMSQGRLFWTEGHRLAVLALLLENLGADQAVRVGDPQVWREAVARLENAGSAR